MSRSIQEDYDGNGYLSLENEGDKDENLEKDVISDIYCEDLMDSLTPRQREIAELRLQGFNNAEIAKKLETTEGAIEQMFHRLKRKF